MQSLLMMRKVWRIVEGTKVKPAETEKLEAWEEEKQEAVGCILLGLNTAHRSTLTKEHLQDPKVLWDHLKAQHVLQNAAYRFNAYTDLFECKKKEGESLVALKDRVVALHNRVVATRPTDFKLSDLENDLKCMALIRALPPSLSAFQSSLSVLLGNDMKFDKLSEAYRTQDLNLQHNGESTVLANAATSSSSSSSLAVDRPYCTWCKRHGHVEEKCFNRAALIKLGDLELEKSGKWKKGKKSTSANQAEVVEFGGSAEEAGTASSLNYLDVFLSKWLADTGATSHMTPHREWFWSYEPYVVPIRLANGTVVHSEGVGLVRFKPAIDNSPILVFSRVLHVPQLSSSLFSVLYLTKHKGFIVVIDSDRMSFTQDGKTLFTATISPTNAAHLDGQVLLPPPVQAASAACTRPMDRSLWHSRFGHLYSDALERIISKDLVTGLTLKSDASRDPICEPCIAGKQHAIIPKEATFRATRPLELVHIDIHGPMPVASREHYRYWLLAVDDCTRKFYFKFLKQKSEAEAAFWEFKAMAELETGHKIRRVRDDGGGEFISNSFLQGLRRHGIRHQATVTNRPHQNGVAERANRTVKEGATALRVEAGLPESFWPYAVATYI